ncbi:hypothetical protein BBI11_04785 [Planococcus maritimus]|uniref:hypothetical protein n=1 Tax=Planococcus maritimus TaxID=192421 RepID=UPI00080F0E26|nr:hypothetical protein [Planococcus maritimus]ANU16414.1 hypothetical protein BBI11_04785 [Planococcus maritimus]
MVKLVEKLRMELASNGNVDIVNELSWQVPLISYEVSYSRIKRFKMDILMKMLLLTFQEADIRRPAALAEMLLVEELFIRDLIDKMHHTQLIRLDPKGYRLTDKGYGQLERGIFEEAMDGESDTVSFSAAHNRYWLIEDVQDKKQTDGPVYRYATESSADKNRIQELLAQEKDAAEEGYQVLVADVLTLDELGYDAIPCIEFQLYDRKQDLFYARVWNTKSNTWDDVLQKQIEKQELVTWREAMASQESAPEHA